MIVNSAIVLNIDNRWCFCIYEIDYHNRLSPDLQVVLNSGSAHFCCLCRQCYLPDKEAPEQVLLWWPAGWGTGVPKLMGLWYIYMMDKDNPKIIPLPIQISQDRFREFSALSHGLQNCAGLGLSRCQFMDRVSQLILDFLLCHSVELWLTEGELRYRWKNSAQHRSSPDFEIFSRECPPEKISENHRESVEDFFRQIPLSYLEGSQEPSAPVLLEEGGIKACLHNETLRWKPSGVPRLPNSYLLLPLPLKGRDRGLMCLCFEQNHSPDSQELELLIQLAQTLGIAISNRRSLSALGERVKELSCLYNICKLFKRPGVSLAFILRHVVRLLPPAMQFPGIAHGRIIFDGQVYETPGIPQENLSLESPILIQRKKRGQVEVIYPRGHPELEFGVFLQEERSLLDSVARQVALIVERTEAEREKLRLEEQLRHADQLATIGQIASGVAHELNEPLGSILGFAQLAHKSPGLPEQVEKDLGRILKASLHAREIVRKLLIYARQMPVSMGHVHMNQVMQDVISFLEHRLEKEKIQLVTSLQEDLPPITADLPQVRQVILNLMVNAIQAMPRGGSLVARTSLEGEWVAISIEDTGVGMDEQVQKKIFDPFFTTKEVGKGTGLGLAVVHGIMTSHGGSISVESEKDLGTTFRVLFPRNRRSYEEREKNQNIGKV